MSLINIPRQQGVGPRLRALQTDAYDYSPLGSMSRRSTAYNIITHRHSFMPAGFLLISWHADVAGSSQKDAFVLSMQAAHHSDNAPFDVPFSEDCALTTTRYSTRSYCLLGALARPHHRSPVSHLISPGPSSPLKSCRDVQIARMNLRWNVQATKPTSNFVVKTPAEGP